MIAVKGKPPISIIIPTLNEAYNLKELIPFLFKEVPKAEIIVVDAESKDNSFEIAKSLGAIALSCSKMSRAVQMNIGAEKAQSDLLYFVHADTLPPKGFFKQIKEALNEGFEMGCFRFKFNSPSKILAINAYFTRFDRLMCRGGDQSLFIQKRDFERLGGYKDEYRIMEEYEFLIRARKHLSFKILEDDVLVSARKYEENSYLKVNFANLVVFTLFRFGAKQSTMIKAYRKLLSHPKSESLA